MDRKNTLVTNEGLTDRKGPLTVEVNPALKYSKQVVISGHGLDKQRTCIICVLFTVIPFPL